jgi:hypothetical protein
MALYGSVPRRWDTLYCITLRVPMFVGAMNSPGRQAAYVARMSNITIIISGVASDRNTRIYIYVYSAQIYTVKSATLIYLRCYTDAYKRYIARQNTAAIDV